MFCVGQSQRTNNKKGDSINNGQGIHAKKLFDCLEIEVELLGSIFFTRVPGGWLVRPVVGIDNDIPPVFVPYSEEFKI